MIFEVTKSIPTSIYIVGDVIEIPEETALKWEAEGFGRCVRDQPVTESSGPPGKPLEGPIKKPQKPKKPKKG